MSPPAGPMTGLEAAAQLARWSPFGWCKNTTSIDAFGAIWYLMETVVRWNRGSSDAAQARFGSGSRHLDLGRCLPDFWCDASLCLSDGRRLRMQPKSRERWRHLSHRGPVPL